MPGTVIYIAKRTSKLRCCLFDRAKGQFVSFISLWAAIHLEYLESPRAAAGAHTSCITFDSLRCSVYMGGRCVGTESTAVQNSAVRKSSPPDCLRKTGKSVRISFLLRAHLEEKQNRFFFVTGYLLKFRLRARFAQKV